MFDITDSSDMATIFMFRLKLILLGAVKEHNLIVWWSVLFDLSQPDSA